MDEIKHFILICTMQEKQLSNREKATLGKGVADFSVAQNSDVGEVMDMRILRLELKLSLTLHSVGMLIEIVI
ncbi:hypothetical protein QQP08_027615 [Theobroma cacao]|nr:hypothetical protein QQP08_027615 [Theobroma cacao]